MKVEDGGLEVEEEKQFPINIMESQGGSSRKHLRKSRQMGSGSKESDEESLNKRLSFNHFNRGQKIYQRKVSAARPNERQCKTLSKGSFWGKKVQGFGSGMYQQTKRRL